MTLGVARAATAPELALFRTEGQWSKIRAAILSPATVYTARINQAFSSWDGVLEITYDGGSGTLADVLPDMTMLIGSTAGAYDIGICRVRSIDATKVYIGEASDMRLANDQYLTILRDFGLCAKHVLISSAVPYMDGGIAYSDQHGAPDPTPIMGGTRVLKLEGATISTQYDFSDSYVVGGMSTITGYSLAAPTADSITGPTTATPTVIFDAVGWHPIYLTLTAANGKTFVGVRWVYVWDDSNPPASVALNDYPTQDAETGGWKFSITLFDNVTLTDVRDRAFVVLFEEGYYGDTKSSIGQVAGCENVLVEGWIAGEEIDWDPEQGLVAFTAYDAHHWFGKIPSFPDGVELVTYPPTAWTEFQGLTVAKGLWHFLHWRSTATRIMDVFLPDDTKYTKEVSSLASNLWEQLRETAFLQIFARPIVNAHNQLLIQVHPQLVPLASRDWAAVMTITKADWEGQINLDRVIVPPNALVDFWGVSVNANGAGAPYHAFSPGHAYPHYGEPETVDNVLVASQADANQKAGLYRGWQNNPYPDIPIKFSANNRIVDCAPRMKFPIVIEAADTPRGIAYSGNLIPKSVQLVPDPETGYLHTEARFEAETFEDIAVTAAIPGSRTDISLPPLPRIPPLPDQSLFPIIPGTIEVSAVGPKKIVMHETTYGLVLADKFNTDAPVWSTINGGLLAAAYQFVNWMAICPNGAFYVAYIPAAGDFSFVARAPYVGGTFEILYESATGDQDDHIWGVGINPLLPECVAFIKGAAGATNLFVGSYGAFVEGAALGGGAIRYDAVSYGGGKWLLTHFNSYVRISADGSTIESSGGADSITIPHLRIGSTGYTYHNSGSELWKGTDNLTSIALINNTDSANLGVDPIGGACDPSGQFIMCQGLGGTRAKSSDFGAAFTLVGGLPVANWFYCYAGPNGNTPRFVAVSSYVYYSPDFGTSWERKDDAALLNMIPIPVFNMVKVVEY